MPESGHIAFKTNVPACHCPGCAEFMEGHCCLYSRLGLTFSATMEPLYPSGLQMPLWHFRLFFQSVYLNRLCYIRGGRISAKEPHTYWDTDLPSSQHQLSASLPTLDNIYCRAQLAPTVTCKVHWLCFMDLGANLTVLTQLCLWDLFVCMGVKIKLFISMYLLYTIVHLLWNFHTCL